MPPRPSPTLQALFCGTPPALTLACELVATTCSPLTAAPALSAQDRAWCERTAKALRPGHWLEPGQDPLALLRAWLDEPTWQRARLAFPRDRIIAVEGGTLPEPPAAKLDTLWQSAGWKAGQSLLPPAADHMETHNARPALA
ncbi:MULTISPECIES: type III secretion protein [Pseudomonas]|uniref:type III secretion protein n=1 Tax=Pseudomonas TaxID=286 RepID=UPI001BE9AFC7|nr:MULTISPECIES: type III secretion protein [Pseudomonas]MBT2340237.1 type III secretion protein [Pseudomonas fluorescens]MCD4530245.1 type III secretion protein [Pseudomonas sp. C3-2018]